MRHLHLTGLFFTSLLLAACGSDADSTSSGQGGSSTTSSSGGATSSETSSGGTSSGGTSSSGTSSGGTSSGGAGGAAAATCDDTTANGDESDVDCGGSECPACDDGAMCNGPSDCESQVCTGGTCQPAMCGDQVINGMDTCDDGMETATCDDDCTAAECGDMNVNKTAGEVCDDGNMVDDDGCSSTCQLQQILATQDFELMPAMPEWTYTGAPNDFQMGLSPANATPANSPLGIGASRAWHVRQVSGGNPLEFADVAIPAGFDQITLRFRLAAMNLNGTTGGPDTLDYVLLELKVDGGAYYNRVRVRGATQNNCSWAYDATAVASVPHLPMMEMMFQPTTSGLQTTDGYSTVEVTFPGTVTQIGARITPRSSSASDSWLIDDLVLIGETL